ncbi:MAG: glycosyltransferase [Flavobacterium sp.]|nr:glycosyltransferase [Flavobacterium sp.]MBP8156780.1 glycosyltransferase [Flavobacterium sp.]
MIKILTTKIHHQNSGGTIYNSELLKFLNDHGQATQLDIITSLNDYSFEKNNTYIIDGILIQTNLNLAKIKNHNVFFLIHLWPSQNPALSIEMEKELLLLEKEICLSAQIVVTGTTSLEHLTDNLNCPTNRAIFIPPGVPRNWTPKINYPKLPKKIIYLSNFIEGKGHLTMVEIMAKTGDDSISVDCYGEILSESYFNNFNNRIESQQLTNIHYKGVVDYTQINILLLNYDLLLHFSEYESFGMSCLEAVATRLPMIMTPTGNYKAYEDQGIKGILKTFSFEEAEEYLNLLLSSETNYQEYIDALQDSEVTYWDITFKPLLLILTKP